MASNVTIPAQGTGTTTPVIATREKTGVQYQTVEIDLGGSGGTYMLQSGVATSGGSIPVVGPNDEFVTVSLDVTRPANTTAYAINDCLSDSTSAPTTFTIANAAKASGGSGLIIDIVVLSDADPAIPLQGEIFLFDSSVTSPNDNAAFALSDADAKKCIGKVPFVLEDIGNNEFFHAQGLNIGFSCVGSADLRFLIRTKNAYVPANGEVLTFRFKIQRLT